MRTLLAVLAVLFSAPSYGQELPAYDGAQPSKVIGIFIDRLMVDNNGSEFACEWAKTGVAVVFMNCVPFVSERSFEQYRKAEAEKAEQAEQAALLAAEKAKREGTFWEIAGSGILRMPQLEGIISAYFESVGCKVSLSDVEALNRDLANLVIADLGLDQAQAENNKDVIDGAIDTTGSSMVSRNLVTIDPETGIASLSGCSR